jgi:hypothetical protein
MSSSFLANFSPSLIQQQPIKPSLLREALPPLLQQEVVAAVNRGRTERRGQIRRDREDEAWKKVPPKAGEPKVKQHGNKTWNWCKHHQAWCIHLEEKCEKGKQLQQKQTVANQATKEQQPAEAATGINPSFIGGQTGMALSHSQGTKHIDPAALFCHVLAACTC